MERFALGVTNGRSNEGSVRIEELEQFVSVKACHTLTLLNEIVAKNDKVIRDKWGIISSGNEPFNQRGEFTLRFYIDVLVERSPKWS